jgi:tRNA U34 5-carboxymethylaminomethyl modifying GTPase MnmE/TrmE
MLGLDAATLGDDRTIAAVSTPIGRGALAVVRISGPRSRTIAELLLDPAPSIHRRESS